MKLADCSAFPPQEDEDAMGAAEDYADDYQPQFEQAAFEGLEETFRRAAAGRPQEASVTSLR